MAKETTRSAKANGFSRKPRLRKHTVTLFAFRPARSLPPSPLREKAPSGTWPLINTELGLGIRHWSWNGGWKRPRITLCYVTFRLSEVVFTQSCLNAQAQGDSQECEHYRYVTLFGGSHAAARPHRQTFGR